jgi:hypothetical protein
LDITKVVNDLTIWSQEVSYSVTELISAQQLGRPIDTQMLAALNLKHQMDTDQMVYIGDPAIGATGLLNHVLITNTNTVAVGAAGSTTWQNKTPDEVTSDFNELLYSTWKASGFKAPPTKVVVAPNPFGYISTTKIGDAAQTSILKYVRENNIMTAQLNIDLDILPVKWLDAANFNGPGGAAFSGGDQMFAYTQKDDYVRFPLVPLQPLQPQYRGIWVSVPYFGRLGRVEAVYPETAGSRQGIG